MAKVYKCDACGVMMDDPYWVRMKEFYIGRGFCGGRAYESNLCKKTKVHLCDKCYRNLNDIAAKAQEE